MNDFRLRQVHLDFHTSPAISGIGERFDKNEWQQALIGGCVDSITVFSKCHHGYSYHPTKINQMHPGLGFDLLKAQLDACKEIGVKAPVYISAGLDEKDAVLHHEWIARNKDDYMEEVDFSYPGYHLLCFNTPYLDKLIAEIEEVMQVYDPCEIFLDIVDERRCYCETCRRRMEAEGIDWHIEENVAEFGKRILRNYLNRTYQAVKKHNPDTVIFQNSGHIYKGRRDRIDTMEHLELESLPTGGWGYDHFPMTAAYARTLRQHFLGMTGKFHQTWGEFGGFKHPNALIYETSLSLAMGGGCSIGDQMHPEGKLNPSTFSLIGKAYSLVKQKEPWCKGARVKADIGVLSIEALLGRRGDARTKADVGANRILLEKKRTYDFLDLESDFSAYKLIILPDYVPLEGELFSKVTAYLNNGGKLLLTGCSCMSQSSEITAALGIQPTQKSEFSPTYYIPDFSTVNGTTEYVMRSEFYGFHNLTATVFAYMQEPYFNRTAEHFCSHQHAPNNRAKTVPAAVINENIAYIGWTVFKTYAEYGDLHVKELVSHALDLLMGDDYTLMTDLPDRGVATVTRLDQKTVVHLLFAHTTLRGKTTEVIEDIVPVYNTLVSVKMPKPEKVTLVPQNTELAFTYQNGRVSVTVPKVDIHQMICFE